MVWSFSGDWNLPSGVTLDMIDEAFRDEEPEELPALSQEVLTAIDAEFAAFSGDLEAIF